MGNGAGRGQHPCCIAHVVVVLHHHRQRNQRHGNDLTGHGAGNGAQNETDNDHGIADAAAPWAKELAHGVQHVFGQTTLLQYRAHQCEERNGQQQIVVQDGEDGDGQVAHEGCGKPTHLNRVKRAGEA